MESYNRSLRVLTLDVVCVYLCFAITTKEIKRLHLISLKALVQYCRRNSLASRLVRIGVLLEYKAISVNYLDFYVVCLIKCLITLTLFDKVICAHLKYFFGQTRNNTLDAVTSNELELCNLILCLLHNLTKSLIDLC